MKREFSFDLINKEIPYEVIKKKIDQISFLTQGYVTCEISEYIGKISGYSYHDKKGRIPGAVYGYAGTSATTLEDYRNIDNTMRNADEIKALWKDAGIDTNKHLMFMCGSGWRAAEVLTYANVMGFDNTSLYSDGWIGWSNDTSNPTETGEPK